MRTKQELREALSTLAARGPAAEDVVDRLQLPGSSAVPAQRRPNVVVAAVALVVVVAIAVLPSYLRPRPPEPADRRVPGHWAMVSRLEPPPGWTLVSRHVSEGFEASTVTDSSHKAGCRIEVSGRGVAPQTPIPSLAEPVTVHDRSALYASTPGRGAAVYWHYSADAWAVVDCWLRPDGLGSADSPGALRELVLQLAESVTFSDVPLRLPIGIEALPGGYVVESVTQDLTNPERWGIVLKPAQVSPTTPRITIGIGDVGGAVSEPNTRVGDYPAFFFTVPLRGPMRRAPRTEVASTSLCIPTAPVGVCLSTLDTAADDPENRRGPFHAVATRLRYAASPTDTTTWFDANDALPS